MYTRLGLGDRQRVGARRRLDFYAPNGPFVSGFLGVSDQVNNEGAEKQEYACIDDLEGHAKHVAAHHDGQHCESHRSVAGTLWSVVKLTVKELKDKEVIPIAREWIAFMAHIPHADADEMCRGWFTDRCLNGKRVGDFDGWFAHEIMMKGMVGAHEIAIPRWHGIFVRAGVMPVWVISLVSLNYKQMATCYSGR